MFLGKLDFLKAIDNVYIQSGFFSSFQSHAMHTLKLHFRDLNANANQINLSPKIFYQLFGALQFQCKENTIMKFCNRVREAAKKMFFS